MDIGKDLQNAYDEGYADAKEEVAREIFEDIKDAYYDCIWIDITTRKGYLQETKFLLKLVEIKKKYTEDKT